jgi:DNA primase
MDEEAKPKYLNSPDTILYRKNRILYGLHQARASIKEKGFVIFVEGYMDFLSLYQAGIKNVVATSGTALTEEHGQLIRRFTSKIVLVFDGDSAGTVAAERAVFTLAPQNLDMYVFILPEGEDPDTYISKTGPDSFYKKCNEANDAVQFIINRAVKIYSPETAKGKSSIVEHILPLIQSTSDTIMKAELIKKTAEKLDIQEHHIYAKLPRRKRRGAQPENEPPVTVSDNFIETEEGSFLHILVKEPELIETAQKHLTTETFSDSFIKKLFSLIVRTYTADKSLKHIIDRTDNSDIKKALSLMLIKEIPSDNHKDDLSHKVKRFLLRLNKKEMHEITLKIRNEKNPDAKKKLLHDQKVLITQRGDLVNKW